MKFEEYVYPTQKLRVFTATAPDRDRLRWLKSLLRCFAERVVPLHVDIAWDFIRVDVEPDVGRVSCVPASSESRFGIEVAGCYVEFPDLLDEYTRLEGLPDEDEFDRLVAEATSLLCDQIEEAASALGVGTNSPTEGLRVEVWDPMSRNPMRVFSVVPSASRREA